MKYDAFNEHILLNLTHLFKHIYIIITKRPIHYFNEYYKSIIQTTICNIPTLELNEAGSVAYTGVSDYNMICLLFYKFTKLVMVVWRNF